MSGPPPQPIRLRVMRGNPSKRRIGVELEPEIAESVPEPPPFITGTAADEWWRVAGELHRLGLLTVLDVMALAQYCSAFQTWRTALETHQVMAASNPATSGLLVKRGDGSPTANPLLSIARKAAGDMIRAASEFGMSPAARARIAAGVGYEPPRGNKFDGLIA